LESGDIVKIEHKRTKEMLTCSMLDLEPLITEKPIVHKNEIGDSFSKDSALCITKYLDTDKKNEINISLEPPQKKSINDLWEI